MSNEMFHVLDQNNDELEYTDAELNRYFLSGHVNTLVGDEELIKPIDEIDILDIQEMINVSDAHDESTTEIVLSQRLSQLSTTNDQGECVSKRPSSGSSVTTANKRIRTTEQQNEVNEHESHDNDKESDQEIPDYLLLDSQLFLALVHKIKNSVTTISSHEIHEIALLKHRIGVLSIRKDLTETYLRSVTGTLLENMNDITGKDRRVWPMEIQSLVLAHRRRAATATITGPLDMTDENIQQFCDSLLQEHLKERLEQIKQLESDLENKTLRTVAYSSTVSEIINDYVETHGLISLKLKRDYKIATIKYKVEAELLERQYQNEKPNSYQNDIGKRLTELRRDLEQSKHEVFELKQRVFYNKPPLNLKLSTSTRQEEEQPSTKSEFINREHILQAHKVLDRICYDIRYAEEKYHRNQVEFDRELSEMWKKHRNLVKDQGMTTGLLHSLEKRFENVANRFNDIYNYRVDYYLKYSYESSKSQENRSEPISLSFNSLLTEKHPFSDRELQLLNRGPAYVPSCQMYVSSADKSLDDRVKAYYAPFKCQLTNLFAKYHINIALVMSIQKKSYDLFKDLFLVSLPADLQERAIFEKYLIYSIYAKLHAHDLMVQRTADNMNTFYLMDRADYNKRTQRSLTISDDYTLLISTRPSQVNATDEEKQAKIKDMITAMNGLLESLKKHKCVPSDDIKKLIVDASRVKLPYVQFLPDISKDPRIALVPFIVANDSATWKIGKYIDQLLRPVVREKLKLTTFHDEIDLVRQLNTYTYTERRLKPETVFCSLKIRNFYAMDTHSNLIDTVGYFLQDHLATNRLNNLSILTIKNLLHIFLYYNIFSYNDDIYRIDRGSPQSIPLSETLSNIYIFVWQKKILKEVQEQHELFGRCKDQIFFTWSKSSSSELFAFVQKIREDVETVRFDIFNGRTVPFLNVSIENRHGNLYTRVLHEPELQRYHLPYVNGHSKLAHSEWLRSALIRAVCCSTFVREFHEERIYLEVTFLANGYSLQFVETHIQHFFNYFHTPNMRYTLDEALFNKFRHQWYDYMLLQCEQTEELNKLYDCGQVFQLNYFYEYGPRCQFNKKFHELWSHYFSKHPNLSCDRLKLQIKPKHYQTLNTLLCSKTLKNLIE